MTENTYTRSDDGTPHGNGFTGEAAASDGTVLVTSATGKSGRRVAERLTALGVPVRPGSRTGGVAFAGVDD
ncbi:hypothetical protein ACFV00_33690 [Streptomyces californicus]|uniref:hypothetical protein n=1 Tax=Streptomyces californicus TaxID=67351 RepID=UPI0036BF6791